MYHNVERYRPLTHHCGARYIAWDSCGRKYYVYPPRNRNQVWSAYGTLDNAAKTFRADTLRELSAKLEQHDRELIDALN